jgi:hypothetical protein
MAWNHLRRQKLHTALSVVGGSVGVTLIIAAVVFYQSFDYSGKRWVNAHFGPIEWELVPADGNPSLTGEQVRQIVGHPGSQTAGIAYLPVVKYSATAVNPGTLGQAGEAAERMTVLGLDFASASAFDPGLEGFREAAPRDDQAVVSEPAARLLGLVPGDALGIMDVRHEVVYFQVAAIVEERGITGYRDGSLSSGTILLNERVARQLAGLPDGEYRSVFATKPANPNYVSGDPPGFPLVFHHTAVVNQKGSALMTLEQWKWTYAAVLALTSGFAALAGVLLVRQILLLQLDFRREASAVLRAIGLSRRQIRLIFFAEAGLLVALGTLAGTMAGSAAGYGIMRLFQDEFAETLMKYGSLSIPLVPYVSVRSVTLTAACLLAVLLFAAWLIGGRAGKVPIVETLRAGTGGTAERKPKRAVRRALLFVCCAVVTAHLYDVISGAGVKRFSDMGADVTFRALSVFVLWLLASVAMLYLLFSGAKRLESRFRGIGKLAGVAPVSLMLAFRYPAQKMNRSFAVALMFSLVFAILLATITYAAPMMRFHEENAVSKTFFGYPAVVPYANEQERGRIETLIRDDELLRKAIRHHVAVEPYRLDMDSPGTLTGKAAFSIVAPDEAYLKAARLPLRSRAAEFSTDEEAWNAVLRSDDYVILHEVYAYAADDWPDSDSRSRSGLPVRRLQPGDTIELYIYPNYSFQPFSFESEAFRQMTEDEARLMEKKIREEIEERRRKQNTPVGVRKLKIAGFVSMEKQVLYNHMWFVSPAFSASFREYGYHWPDDPEGGYYLLDVDLQDLDGIHELQETFLLAGFDSLHIPALEQLARSTMDRHMYAIYVAFMIVSVVIGMAGLAIVQHRAVRERARQLAMLRFVGVGKRQIAQMFLLEGIWIGWTGIWNGALFGTLGGYLLFKTVEVSRPPDEPIIPFHYPVAPVAVILIAAMLSAWLLNLWPARKGNRLSPAEAIRIAD